jgi:hypothetical protein
VGHPWLKNEPSVGWGDVRYPGGNRRHPARVVREPPSVSSGSRLRRSSACSSVWTHKEASRLELDYPLAVAGPALLMRSRRITGHYHVGRRDPPSTMQRASLLRRDSSIDPRGKPTANDRKEDKAGQTPDLALAEQELCSLS